MPRRNRWWKLTSKWLLAAALGVAAMLSLPNFGAWWAAPVGLGLLAVLVRTTASGDSGTAGPAATTGVSGTAAALGASNTTAATTPTRRWWHVFGLVYMFWAAAYGFGMIWLTDLTVAGWIIVASVEALFMALPLAVVLWVAGSGRTVFLGLPAALMLSEVFRWTMPFGGVPLSNLALGAANSPLAPLARLAGPLALVAAIGLLAAAIDALRISSKRISSGRSLVGQLPSGQILPRQLWSRLSSAERSLAKQQSSSHRWVTTKRAAIAAGCVVFLALLGAFAPAGRAVGELQVAVLQSGGDLGVQGRRGDVFAKHLEVTREHAAQLANTDLVVWSESSASSGAPLEGSTELAQIEALATEIDATIIANFYERTVGEEPSLFRNATVSVAPATGLIDRYDKVHLVPFGEYIPLRSLIDRFADTSLVERDGIPGTEPALLDSPHGPLVAVSSFEIYFPSRVHSGIKEGGQLVVNPTLASSYRSDWIPEQSLASARLRAIESGRWVLQASTTGYSAIVSPSGEMIGSTALSEAGVVFATAELREGRTWAYVLGTWPVVLLALLALGVWLYFGLREQGLLSRKTAAVQVS